ncbi:MAG: T9SS type A sorting domain-containing protein, partial [Bacteroidota bacterium]|nr:T9SS type A sorting domain-containing protein [Bacteroidota bacterium]
VLNRSAYGNPNTWGGSAASSFEKDDKLRSIAFSSPNVGFAGGINGILYKLEQVDTIFFNGPWNINLDLNPTGPQTIKSISFPSESRGMFLTSAEVSGVNFALVYHTNDTGATWTATPDSIQDLFANALTSPDTLTAWVVGHDGKIYKGFPKPSSINTMSLDIDISIYPNPATDFINVELYSKRNEQIRYSLLDMTGRVIEQGVWNSNSSNSSFTLNLSNVIKGVYLLKLSTDERQSTFRVLKN